MIPGSKFCCWQWEEGARANPRRGKEPNSPAAARVAAGTRQQWEVRARDFDDAWTAGRLLIGPRMVAGGFHAHHEAQPAHKTPDPSPPARASGLPWQPSAMPALPYHASHLKHSPSPSPKMVLALLRIVSAAPQRNCATKKRLGKGGREWDGQLHFGLGESSAISATRPLRKKRRAVHRSVGPGSSRNGS